MGSRQVAAADVWDSEGDCAHRQHELGPARVILEKGCAVVNFAPEHCPCVLCLVVLWRVACSVSASTLPTGDLHCFSREQCEWEQGARIPRPETRHRKPPRATRLRPMACKVPVGPMGPFTTCLISSIVTQRCRLIFGRTFIQCIMLRPSPTAIFLRTLPGARSASPCAAAIDCAQAFSMPHVKGTHGRSVAAKQMRGTREATGPRAAPWQ